MQSLLIFNPSTGGSDGYFYVKKGSRGPKTFPNSFERLENQKKIVFQSVLGDLEGVG